MVRQPEKRGGPIERKTLERLRTFTETVEADEKISARFRCRKIVLDLRPMPYGAEQVKKVRKSLNVSQAMFAQLLGVSIRTVQNWEQGLKTPESIACRFMDEIANNPQYWRERIVHSTREVEATV